jgi:hypothetical protein
MTEIEQKKATKIAMSAGRWGVELLLPTTYTFFLPVTGVCKEQDKENNNLSTSRGNLTANQRRQKI